MADVMDVYNAEQHETEVFKCPACGANLTFSPSKQMLVCDHCGGEFELGKTYGVEPVDFATGERPQETWGEETVVYRCENCGAKEILSRTEIAKTCPFCGTTNIVATNELSGMKPNGVLPFLFDEEAAKKNFLAWIKKKWFVPNKLKKQAAADQTRGVYSPCWLFNANSSSMYNGRLGERYTVTVGSGKNRRTETRIRWFTVSGNYDRGFEDYIVEASPYLTQRQVDDLRPFQLDKAVAYDQRFLAGFAASHYDKDMDTSWLEARRGLDEIIRREILNLYHADVVDFLNVSSFYKDVTFRYMLLPIWICNYKFKSKIYHFYVNGSTGKVVGKVPRSPIKIGLFSLGMLALAALLIWLIMTYMN